MGRCRGLQLHGSTAGTRAALQHTFRVVVIEQQLRQRNVQACRIEANLEGLFFARGKCVHIMPPTYKLGFHGLLSAELRSAFVAWENEAAAKQASRTVSKQQQTRLNKKMAQATAVFF